MTESIAPPLPVEAAELDEGALQRLHELDPDGSNRVVERVLQAFDASLLRLLPQGDQALARLDSEALRHVVHTLKSSSASVGALELSRRCNDIESRLRDAGLEGVDRLWAGLHHEGRRVLAAVQSMLSCPKAHCP